MGPEEDTERRISLAKDYRNTDAKKRGERFTRAWLPQRGIFSQKPRGKKEKNPVPAEEREERAPLRKAITTFVVEKRKFYRKKEGGFLAFSR